MILYNQTEVKMNKESPMENTLGNALQALRQQVQAGFRPDSQQPASIERPTTIGNLITRAEESREELRRHNGLGR
jgi:hypothetical protein